VLLAIHMGKVNAAAAIASGLAVVKVLRRLRGLVFFAITHGESPFYVLLFPF
jgi:hypothetical protein